jgi:D-alanyl-D-alanine carboxypeptidase/D-alanyl-D-alanine-endopeptidase (penicillin-binding protein 4)
MHWLWGLIFAVQVHAAEVAGRLNKVIQASGVAKSNLGLVVFDVNRHEPLFQLNDTQSFTPASITKLATAFTVLHRLGPSFKFQTSLWSAGKIENGVLKGDLILKGGGDAGFVSETMWFLVNEFMRTGVQKIEGDVVVDDTDFDNIRTDPSRDPERVDRAYDAPVGAMSFNWNSVNIFVRPTSVGEPPQVYLDPLNDYFQIDNRAKTVNKSGSTLDISRDDHRIAVHGSIGIGHDEVTAFKNVDDPVDWSGKNLVFFLSQRGISVSGKVKAGKRPEAARQLCKADSKPVGQHVADMMKFSNNYVAEMLTKDLSKQEGETPATLEGGMKQIRAYLTSQGIEAKNFTLLNPSGLSRKNRMRPRDLVEILMLAQKDFPTFAEMLSALPLAGEDGTLKKRMIGTPAEGWVRAKTGSMAGIVSLAGFAGRKDGNWRAFAFVFNGKADQGESVRHLFDQMAAELVQ